MEWHFSPQSPLLLVPRKSERLSFGSADIWEAHESPGLAVVLGRTRSAVTRRAVPEFPAVWCYLIFNPAHTRAGLLSLGPLLSSSIPLLAPVLSVPYRLSRRSILRRFWRSSLLTRDSQAGFTCSGATGDLPLFLPFPEPVLRPTHEIAIPPSR